MRARNFSAFFLSIVMLFSLMSCSDGTASEITRDTLIGEWYSDELRGSFVFKDDDMLYLKVDFTNTMYIDESGSVELSSGEPEEAEYSYDGTHYSFSMGKGDTAINMITMERKGEPSDSIYGEYTLLSGILYDQLSAEYGDVGDRYGMIVSENRLESEIRMCGYETDGENITFVGDDLAVFGATEDTIRYRCNIENGVMTLVGTTGSLVFTKVSE